MKKLLLLILIIAGVKYYKDRSLDPSSLARSDVILYATNWCGYCQKTRQFFAIHRIPYTEYNIETSAYGKARYDKIAKGSGVPVVEIKGNVIRGYSERLLRSQFGLD